MMKHLDLGCGLNPHNPYNADQVFGCDIIQPDGAHTAPFTDFKLADLAFENIPFEDETFDSISAINFLEHIPRQVTFGRRQTRNSFIELMNDIHRVLKPNGRLFAISPVYPHSDAFTDPTHVNFITRFSHRYFVVPHLTAAQYGFSGKFKEINVVVDAPTNLMMQPGTGLRKIGRRWHRLLFREGLSHILWEFEKV